MPDDVASTYRAFLTTSQAALDIAERRDRSLGLTRLAALAYLAPYAYYCFFTRQLSPLWILPAAVVFVATSIGLVRSTRHRDHLRGTVAYFTRALGRIAGDWAGNGNPGDEFLDATHLYARDLDLFGQGSLFELLCTARTRLGQTTLARWILAPAPTDTLLSRQQAVRELAEHALDLRVDLASLPSSGPDTLAGVRLAEWGQAPPQPLPPHALQTALSALGLIAMLALLASEVARAGVVAIPIRSVAALEALFVLAYLCCGAFTWRYSRQTGPLLAHAEQAARSLKLLAAVVRRLEQEKFEAPLLANLLNGLRTSGRPASGQIARLDRLIDLADSRDHWFVRLFGPLLLWDLQVATALERWRAENGPSLPDWLNSTGEIEALLALATFAYENPTYVYPHFVADTTRFDAGALAHPLLRNAVPNHVLLDPQRRVLIVSGSNMSGKSTLLRAVGVNLVLAGAGAPVRAQRLEVSPLQLGASIRTEDSLRDGTSRFYAEIKRLRQLIDAATSVPPLLFLIDEVLHGTNSHDRRIGAQAILQGLLARGAIGLLTTHDLALTPLAAAEGANVHFQDHLQNGRMAFDYTMRPGVVEKSNAIELMRSIGLEI